MSQKNWIRYYAELRHFNVAKNDFYDVAKNDFFISKTSNVICRKF